MVSDKSKANLAKGRAKGIKRKKPTARCNENNTFAAIFHFIESRAMLESEWEKLAAIGITREAVASAGITDERKLKKCLNIFLDDAPAMVKEYLQRSEPQDPWLLTLDMSKLSLSQLERIANGEDPRAVIAQGAGGD